MRGIYITKGLNMKKIIVVTVLMLVSNVAYSGFWSSVAGGVVANSITGSGGSSGAKRKVDIEQTDEMKMQQALYGLGFYDDKLNGNLNTLESRLAINKFQETNGLKITGIVGSSNRQHLLYIHELYSALIRVNRMSVVDKKKRNQIYNEVDKAVALITKGAE